SWRSSAPETRMPMSPRWWPFSAAPTATGSPARRSRLTAAGRCGERAPGSGRGPGREAAGEGDRLRLQGLREALGAALAAEAGLLVAAERHLGVGPVAVDPVCARADPAGDLEAAIRVGGVHSPGQAEFCVVSDVDRLVHVVVGDDRGDRAE